MMINIKFLPLITLLSACVTTTHQPVAMPIETDTIGEVVAQLYTPIGAASSENSLLPDEFEQRLTHLTLENMKLRQEVMRLKEKLQPRPTHILPTIAPKKKLIKASHVSGTQPEKTLLAPDAPEVPTLAQIAPVAIKNDAYELAQKQFRQKNYQQVINMLRNSDAGGDGSIMARKQMYLLLLSHQKLNNCQSVINIGQRLAGRFSGSHEAAEAQFMVGQCQWDIQQRDIAKDTWRRLIASQPNSSAAQRAKFAINQK